MPTKLGGMTRSLNDGGQYIILEEGDYNFTVSTFERARFPGSAKIPACNKAVLTLAVYTSNGVAFVKYDLILWSSLEWKISEFFRAIGPEEARRKVTPPVERCGWRQGARTL